MSDGSDNHLAADELALQEQATVLAAIRGDQDALRALWHQHRRWVAAILIAHAPREAEIDDLLQEVAMSMVAKLSGVREAQAFRPWLRAVAMSIAKTNARRGNVRKRGWMTIVGLAGGRSGRTSEAEFGLSDASANDAMSEGRRLMELARELPDGYREPLLMKCVQGMSYRQIGEVMGLPETTIETRIARGRRMLRERADKREDTNDAHAAERVAAMTTGSA